MRSRATYDLAVARTLRGLHESGDVSRAALAQALSMSEMEITRLELGVEPLSAGALFPFLDLYGISWEEFRKQVAGHLDEAEAELASTFGHEK